MIAKCKSLGMRSRLSIKQCIPAKKAIKKVHPERCTKIYDF